MIQQALTFNPAKQVTDLGWSGIALEITGLQNRDFDPIFEKLKTIPSKNS